MHIGWGWQRTPIIIVYGPNYLSMVIITWYYDSYPSLVDSGAKHPPRHKQYAADKNILWHLLAKKFAFIFGYSQPIRYELCICSVIFVNNNGNRVALAGVGGVCVGRDIIFAC